MGYEQVRERNPRSSTARSRASAPSASRPAGPATTSWPRPESGLMSITGPEDGPPYKVGVALVDVLAGLHAAAGVLAALHGGEGGADRGAAARQRARRARERGPERAGHGAEPERHGNAHPNIVPYQDFETSSGRIAVAAANDGLFRALCSRDRASTSSRRTSASPPTPPGSSTGGARPAAGGSASASGRRRTGWPRSTPPACRWARCARCPTRSLPPPRPAGRPRYGRAPDRGPARPGGLADLGRHRARPDAAAAAGRAHGRGAGRAGPLARRRSSAARPAARRRCCSAVSAARRRSTPAGATPRPAR